MIRKIKVHFLDWFDSILYGSSKDNIFLDILRKNYDVELDEKNPDVLFYSLKYNAHLLYKNCIKIFCTSEPGYWNPDKIAHIYPPQERSRISVEDADYIITSYHIDNEKHYRLPAYLIWLYHHIYVTKSIESYDCLKKYKNFEKIDNKKFCIFMHRHPSYKRDILFKKLSKYKQVDSAGTFMNNLPPVSMDSYGKINFIKNYKFCFAMQNFSEDDDFVKDIQHLSDAYKLFGNKEISGFICEKVIEPYISNVVPLHFGYKKISEEFNSKSMISWHDYNDDDMFINKIIELDNDAEKYLNVLNQPVYNNDIIEKHIEGLSIFLEKIINKL